MRLGVRLLIAGLIIATPAALFVQHMLDALNRSRQKQTMAGARKWGAAIENVSRHMAPSRIVQGTSAELSALATAHGLPKLDGWGTPYRIQATSKSYLIHAAARDGAFETLKERRLTQSYDSDIAFADGAFFQYPEGI